VTKITIYMWGADSRVLQKVLP